jgi:tetratricopeptide (TPR) repeat protein
MVFTNFKKNAGYSGLKAGEEGAVKEKHLFALLLFIALLFSWLAMSPCLRNGFINWDETEYITRNPRIKTLSAESVKTIFTSKDLGMYSPLPALSYAVEYRLAGLDPRIYHATSLLLHLANTALVLLLVRSLLGGVWTAFLAGILFGVHPAHVESVAWAAERKDVLYSFFYLSSLAAYAARFNGARTWFLSLLLFACSLLAKPMAVTLPLALLLVDYLKKGKTGVRDWLEKVPFFAMSAAFTVLLLQPGGVVTDPSAVKRLLAPLYNLGFYVYTLLWPFRLSAMYVTPPAGKAGFYVLAAAGAAGLFLAWKYLRKDRETLFGASFFLLMLLPVLQFFPFSLVLSADRYTYLSSIGFFLVLLDLARRLWLGSGSRARQAAVLLSAAAIMTLTVASRVRCAAWENGISLWSDTLRKQPAAAPALVNLCGAYIEAGRNEEAEACLWRAISEYPGHDGNYYNLGVIYARRNNFAAAEKNFARTLEINPCHAPALNDMGNISLLKGRRPEAGRYYAGSARCDAAYAPAYLNLGKMALAAKDRSGAAAFFRKVLAADPSSAEAAALLGALK